MFEFSIFVGAYDHSDYDILIIVNFREKYLDRTKWIVHIAPPVPVDVFCYTSKEFEEMFYSYNLTAIDAIDEGIVLEGEKFLESYKKDLKKFKEKGMKRGICALHPPKK